MLACSMRSMERPFRVQPLTILALASFVSNMNGGCLPRRGEQAPPGNTDRGGPPATKRSNGRFRRPVHVVDTARSVTKPGTQTRLDASASEAIRTRPTKQEVEADVSPDERTPRFSHEASDGLAQTASEVRQLTAALLNGGVAPREVASVADIRGVRLMKRKRFTLANVWLRAAAQIDPTYEWAVYHAAVCAAKLGQRDSARAQLQRLQRLATPLANKRLQDARRISELATLLKAGRRPPGLGADRPDS